MEEERPDEVQEEGAGGGERGAMGRMAEGRAGGTEVRATFRVRPFMSPRRTLIIIWLTTIMSRSISIIEILI